MTRIRRTRRGLTRLTVLVAVLIGTTALPPVVTARADETTVSADLLRTGWDRAEPNLAPADVGAADFGQLFSTTVDGSVYAQPLVIGDLVIVTTENAKAYGIDKISGAIRWERDFGTPFPASAIGCGDLTPNLGSTSTPVYDPSTATMYLTTKIVTGENPNKPTWFMHAISVVDGSERPGFPITIAGKPDNTPGISFQPFTAMQRPGLLLLGGVVYAGFASHCDINPYRGYVVGVSAATHAITAMWSTEAGSGADASSMAGIWQSGGGLVSDGPGRIILATGNGLSPPASPGSPTPKTLAESVVRLAVGANGKLSARDFFSPADAPTLDQNDTDLGSGGPAALPSRYFGSAAHPNLLVEVGKDGRVFLLDRDNLGGREQGPHHRDGVLGVSGPYAGVWGHPAVYGGEGGWVYTVENSSYLRAFRYGVDGAGVPTLSSAATSAGTFGYTSGSPIVTSDGTKPGSAIVWVESSTGSSGTGGQLRAYAAVPSGSVVQQLWSSPIGIASKFAVPASDSGRVYLGTRDGHVFGFGRPATAALQTSSLEFGDVKVGNRTALTAVATATRDVEVTGVATAAPFTATPPSLPVLLHAGDSLKVPVHFAPASAGDTTAQLLITSDAGAYALDLHGYGTAQGLLAAPPSIDFGTIAVGAGGKRLSVNIANSWTKPEKITATTPPGSPFTVTGLPSVGQVLTPAQSVTVSILYNPATAGTSSDSLVVTSNHGAATIPLTGHALSGHGHLKITPNPLAFGKVAIGDTKTLSFDISNTGNIPITLTKAKAPAGVFSTSTPVSEGLTLDPDAVIHQKITFTPTAHGAATAHYIITADDGQGAQTENLTGRGVAAAKVIAGDRRVV